MFRRLVEQRRGIPALLEGMCLCLSNGAVGGLILRTLVKRFLERRASHTRRDRVNWEACLSKLQLLMYVVTKNGAVQLNGKTRREL